MKTHRQALPEGHRIQEYQLGRVLGAGGFGLTYLGWDTALDKPVAIKEYLPNELAVRESDYSVVPKSSDDEENFTWGLTRFIEEARTLATFNNPSIVAVRRYLEANGTAYIVMEYVEGETLGDLLKREGVISEARLLAILKPLLTGLQEVHAAGFLHRDIKPSNIIIRAGGLPAGDSATAGDGAFVGTAPCGCPPDALGDSSPTGNGASVGTGAPVLVDFGSARQAIGARSRSITAVVTPGYAPFEQYFSSRDKQGPWTDIYALGAVCYKALTGNTPPDATERVRDDPMQPVSEAVQKTSGRSPAQSPGRCTAKFARAVDWALAVDEDQRPQNIAEWEDALDITTGITTHSASTSKAKPSRLQKRVPARKSTGKKSKPAHQTFANRVAGIASAYLKPALWTVAVAAAAVMIFAFANTNLFTTLIESPATACARHSENRHYAQALQPCTKAAEQGDAEAQFVLGWMYDNGKGVWENDAEAEHWYRKAAEQGHASAQYNLGVMYENGRGVQKDYAAAAHWYRKAAEQGLASAQYNLGGMYYDGKGVQKDYAKAVRWYRKAAEQGHTWAQYNLGNIYHKGKGVQQDYAKAVRWYRKAAKQGDSWAQNSLGFMYANGRGVQKDHAEAVRWYRKAAAQGHGQRRGASPAGRQGALVPQSRGARA